MAAIIEAVGLATGELFANQMWVESYNVDSEAFAFTSSLTYAGGRVTGAVIEGRWGGHIHLTTDITKAQRFEDNAAAMRAWNTQSGRVPYRPDGHPNKPMTALTVEVTRVT
jgi:hypothetical protein